MGTTTERAVRTGATSANRPVCFGVRARPVTQSLKNEKPELASSSLIVERKCCSDGALLTSVINDEYIGG